MVDPVDRAIANAPIKDERISEEEERAVAASIAWLAEHPGEGTFLEDMLAEFGLSSKAKAQRQGAAFLEVIAKYSDDSGIAGTRAFIS